MELIGRQFGHIRVTDVVGQGGMGDVYGGYDEKLERKVALKVLNADQRLDAEARERLLREARALSKLDHRNICRIHDYIESGDVDLLVLEYIDGRTLHEALNDRTSHGEKLRIAIAVAEVLVAAHRAGIVHRDLKPENVMLTRSGEVKVLDFGLARWLNRAKLSEQITPQRLAVRGGAQMAMTLPMESVRDSRDNVSGRREFQATAAGITLGTPLYMSPEQARGETLTPASDMFAFGLLLQTLFSGKDPHPPGLTAREVMLRAARGETLPVGSVSRDIASLINRLKQFAPTDRPTAVEALERLRFLADKPHRIARNAAIAIVAMILVTGAWRYTVDLRAERAIAVSARAEAERRRAQAENLIEFMLGDLRKKLEPVGRLDILDDVGERAMKYVQSLDPQTMSVDELLRNAKALNQLGEVRVGQGKTAEALEMFRRALVLADEAVKRDARNAQSLLLHGATHFWVGNALRLQGSTHEALAHMRDYMKDGDALAQLDPANKEYQLERAYGHSGVALILEADGELAEALKHYQTSLAIKQQLSERDPNDLDMQADVARAYNKVAAAQYALGELRAARDGFAREVAIYRGLLAKHPLQAQWKQRLATSIAFLGRALRDTGDTAAATALWREELSIERELAAFDPENLDWQRNVAVTSLRLADVELHTNSVAQAESLVLDARSKLADALRRAPDRTYLQFDRAAVDLAYARVLARRGAKREAESVQRDVVARMQPLTAREPSASYYLARALFDLGELAAAANDLETARESWAGAERALGPSMRTAAPDAMHLDLWTRILLRRGHTAEARVVLDRLQATGYAVAELQTLCRDSGC